jgi:hypothetical protein
VPGNVCFLSTYGNGPAPRAGNRRYKKAAGIKNTGIKNADIKNTGIKSVKYKKPEGRDHRLIRLPVFMSEE